MKNVLLGTAFLLASLATSASLARAAEPGCESTTEAQRRAEWASQQSGSSALRLDGDQAERFLDYLNNKIGRHTEYWGDGVIIGRYPALGYDSVAIVDDGCVDETKLIRLDPDMFEQAYQAAQSSSF
jgi:hypothetical protein